GLSHSAARWSSNVTWAVAARVVSLGAVAVDAWASGAAVPARFCGVASLQGFDVIRDPSTSPLLQRLKRRLSSSSCISRAALSSQYVMRTATGSFSEQHDSRQS